ncbi:macro domain-containing protein [Sulfobacillus harzensis]|uniref:Macro domain-containing protein n=1 Tax=Sulfobacillus harzensis TaxID=2729629 RepID=A0A7Y0Q4K0_9FIRM|nr:macro domain-containing protein [Sulfobacillus harzensis]NMP24500.1 macro domain-containing protein [Sulfobacillus harzensis]
MIEVVFGDAVAALQAGRIDVLGHQVNLDGVMGAGIARQIARTWPGVLSGYWKALRENALVLGGAQIVSVAPERWVANIAGQVHPTRRGRATDYEALDSGLRFMADFLQVHELTGGLPYGIGCGLAGGDWAVVEPMIHKAFADCRLILFRL